MVDRTDSRTEAAQAVWRLLFDVLMSTNPQRQATLTRHDLTPNDSRALYSLKRKEGQAIGTLAKLWGCDPSTATWVVDRLEGAKLAERRPSATDRRVKLVALTAKGEKTMRAIMDEFHEAPEMLFRLDKAELKSLHELLLKLR